MTFVNDNFGYIFGDKSIPLGQDGIIKKTTDGGNSWITQTLGETSLIFKGYFWNANTGYVDGKYGKNFKTTDGGNTWILKSPNSFWWFEDIHFINQNTGFGVEKSIYETTDGGDSWFVNFQSGIVWYYCLHFLNDLTGYASGDGKVTKTTNGGTNWFIVCESLTGWNDVRSIYFTNSNTGFMSSSTNHLLKTTNAGANWFEQILTPSGLCTYSLFFLNENTGFVGCNNGIILKTTNGGVSVNPVSTTVSDKYSLSQNYPNPFNPTTNIKFSIPKSDNVTLKVFNILGKEIATLVNEKLQAGSYEVKFDGTNQPSGVYYYKIVSGDYSEVRKMVLIK